MEQPSPTDDSKHLKEDMERAISKAAAEQEEERSPEALLAAVRAEPAHNIHIFPMNGVSLRPQMEGSAYTLCFLISQANAII